MTIENAASIIVGDWLKIKKDEVFYFITDNNNIQEAQACIDYAEMRGAVTKLTVIPENAVQNGELLEQMRNIMSYANVVIGATTYSFITTDAVDFALKHGARFLSLPMKTNNGRSLFESEFIGMDIKKAADRAKKLIKHIKGKSTLTATTPAGTSITFSMKGRKPGFFNGCAHRRGQMGSASFEVYIPIVETSASGTVVIDGSLGYLGAVTNPIKVTFQNGKITDIDQNADGKRLSYYLQSFNDPEMYFAAEFGIGLNELSHCSGDSYIEDESTAGTFHIGMGRNVALGGTHNAAGHFDIVMNEPDIYADSDKILEKGCINI